MSHGIRIRNLLHVATSSPGLCIEICCKTGETGRYTPSRYNIYIDVPPSSTLLLPVATKLPSFFQDRKRSFPQGVRSSFLFRRSLDVWDHVDVKSPAGGKCTYLYVEGAFLRTCSFSSLHQRDEFGLEKSGETKAPFSKKSMGKGIID